MTVAHLECEAPQLRLEVADTRLGFNGQSAARAGLASKSLDPTIPCALIPGYRKRNLGPESQAGSQSSPQTLQEPYLRNIADRIGTGIDANAHIKTHGSADARQSPMADVGHPTALDPGDLGRRQSGGVPNGRDR
jgi:hypothetical protein